MERALLSVAGKKKAPPKPAALNSVPNEADQMIATVSAWGPLWPIVIVSLTR